jgi:hypothetical protein
MPRTPFPFKDGDVVPFDGHMLTVLEDRSFWDREQYLFGDPANGLVCREGWQVVLQLDGLDYVRLHEDEVARRMGRPCNRK